MARSLKKGPYVDPHVQDRLKDKKQGDKSVVKTWSRRATITPEMVGFAFSVHNGKDFITVQVAEDMVGHKLGEFAPTTKFARHGGKMQKEQEQKESAAAKPTGASEQKKS